MIYCDSKLVYNIIFVVEVFNGMKVYVGKDLVIDFVIFLNVNIGVINIFVFIL